MAFRDRDLQRTVTDLCRLAGVDPISFDSDLLDPDSLDPDAFGTDSFGAGELAFDPRIFTEDSLVLTQSAETGLLIGAVGAIPVICGADGDADCEVRIPSDAGALINRVREWVAGGSKSGRTIIVGSWHGGAGATTASFALARSLRAALLDASGSASFPVPDQGTSTVGWESLDTADMPPGGPLISSLPRIRGVPVLSGAHGTSVRPDDLRVAQVVCRSPRPNVIDCGTDLRGIVQLWDSLLEQGQQVKVVLVGRANDDRASAAACAFTMLTEDQRQVNALTVGRRSSLFQIVQERFDVTWRKCPRPASAKGWQRVARTL